MLKKLVLVLFVLVLAGAALIYFRAQAIFSSDLVRTSVESQLTRALGQPVSIGSIGASLTPRLTMAAGNVRIGADDAIVVEQLDVGTSLGALLSRRIEGATLVVDGARITLPLPAFAIGGSDAQTPDADAGGGGGGGGGVEIVSIESVRFTNMTIVAGNRTLRGELDAVPRPDGMTIRSLRLEPDEAGAIDIAGEITSWEGPSGALTMRADTLDLVALQAFATDFAAVALPGPADAGQMPGPDASTADATPVDLRIAIEAGQARAGDLVIDQVTGNAHVDARALTLEDLAFAAFGGRATGAVAFALGDQPTFDLRAEVDGVDMPSLMTFFGTPGAITGRLTGNVAVTGTGTDAAAIIPSVSGRARLDITDGEVQGLALVRTIVVAGSGRTDAAASGAAGSGSEAFSRLGATLALGGGMARTDDLRFESDDVSLDGSGSFGLDGTNIDLVGRLQLSEALTEQAGRDLVRYTQEEGRVTVPVRVTGRAGDLTVTPEAAELLRRAITNKAVEEAGEAIKRGLGSLFGR